MKISINHQKIERNKKIAQATLYLSLALLALGFIWSIRNTDPEKSVIGWLILMPSYFLVQISIYMANKWGKSPRPDEIVAQSLKGLNDEYALYTFTTRVPYLFVGPHGVWVLNPYHHRGSISYDQNRKRYMQKGGAGFIGKTFGQEGLPNVYRDAEHLHKEILKYIEANNISLETKPEVVNIFFADEAEISGQTFPHRTLKADKMKQVVRSETKKKILSTETLAELEKKLPSFE